MNKIHIIGGLTLSVLFTSISQATVKSTTDSINTLATTTVISATRYEQSIDKIPGAITVINEQALKEQTAISDDLTAIIANLVPGMSPSRQKLSNQGVNLRGRTALLLVDGVPQNNPLRNGNRYGFPLDSAMLSRIEIVNGASAVNGLGATGGTINYITLSAKEGDNWRQTAGLRLNSSFDDDSGGNKQWYNVRHFDEKYEVLFSVARQDRGLYYDGNGNAIGMNMIQGETQDSVSMNYFLKTAVKSDEHKLEFSFNKFELKGNNDYVAVWGDFANKIPGTVEKGTPLGEPILNDVESYNVTYSNDNLAGGGLTAQFFYQDFQAVYGRAWWQPTDTEIFDQGTITSTKKGLKVAYTQSNLLNKDDNWVIGVDVLDDTTQQWLLESNLGVTPEMSYLGIAPFIQGDMLVSERLRLSAGLRFESTEVTVNADKTLYAYGVFLGQGAAQTAHDGVDIIGGKQSFSELVYNLGAVYSVTDNTNVYFGYNQGMGLPDIGRVLRGQWVADDNPISGGATIDFTNMPAVEPVITENFELGVNFSDEQWDLTATTYYSLAKDGANLSLNTGGNYDVVRQRTEIKGLELTANYQLNDNINLQAIYAMVRGEVDSNQSGSVDQDIDLKNVSPDRLMLAMNYNITDNWSSRLQMNALKGRDNSEENQTFDGYVLVDALVKYDLGENGKVTFAVENLADEFYINYFSQVRNFSGYYFSGRGRNFSLGYELDF
ncbi:TonB-dependent receptor [Colwellia sp. 39_35_sub15_T18]|nr:TonB-dependent receptor [Colwellia sp. 39_35_sub15_T18]